MIIKQAILQTEIKAVELFLKGFDLNYRQDADYTAYVEENGEVIGTVSLVKNLIVCLAVSTNYQGENLSATLISHAIAKLREEKIYGYRVFTKPIYLNQFLSLGFNLLVKTDDFIALEGGESNVYKTIDNLKTKITMDFGGFDGDYGAIVMNANPFTNGHLYLVEHALKFHEKVLLFILEEDGQAFSFKERFSMAFLATRPYYDRVSVLPSTEYIVSKSTFPDYFIHGVNAQTLAHAEYDATLFRDYFMKNLKISKRYLGSEEKDYMALYNSTVKKVLNNNAEIVSRLEYQNKPVSAERVRELLKNGETEKALSYIPNSTKAVFNMIIGSKKW